MRALEMTGKDFRLGAVQTRPIATRRVGCRVSKRILVAGHRVGLMHRDEPRNDLDSGWCFLAGLESQEDWDDPARYAVYCIDRIADHDPEIIPLLEAPVGSVSR